MENLELYEHVRMVPKEAQKPIAAGRLKGKTNINPMWRIKELTKQFGPCGVGWSYEIVRQWIEPGADGQLAAFCNINLYIKIGDEWSRPIPGTGGDMFIEKESKGLYTSDECFKKALTDAISVSCKALGFGADIYWDMDPSKYDQPKPELVNKDHIAAIAAELTRVGWDVGGMLAYLNQKIPGAQLVKIEDMTISQFGIMMQKLKQKPDKAAT